MADYSHIGEQERVFKRWCNSHLCERNIVIENMANDFSDGINLFHLLEIISHKKLPFRYIRVPKLKIQKIENVANCLTFMENEGIKISCISAEHIVCGYLKLILGLMWLLILHYNTPSQEGCPGPKIKLLEWVRTKIPAHDIRGFRGDWNNGIALYDLVNAIIPGILPPIDEEQDPIQICETVMNAAKENLNIPKLLDPEDMVLRGDELCIITYISYFYIEDNILHSVKV